MCRFDCVSWCYGINKIFKFFYILFVILENSIIWKGSNSLGLRRKKEAGCQLVLISHARMKLLLTMKFALVTRSILRRTISLS